MKKFTTQLSSKSMQLVKSIIKSEGLALQTTIKNDAIGDTNIIVYGATEEIEKLEKLFNK